MSGLVDTSVLVRYLTEDPPAMAARAAELLDDEAKTIAVNTLLIAETAWVLTSFYQVGRDPLAASLLAFVQRPNVAVVDVPREVLLEALLLYRSDPAVTITDALLWAAARASAWRRIYTFDRSFPDKEIDREVLRVRVNPFRIERGLAPR